MAEHLENDQNPPGKGKKAVTPQALSRASRARLLRVLQAAADGGDVAAAAALLELARRAEQDALLASALAALRGSSGDE